MWWLVKDFYIYFHRSSKSFTTPIRREEKEIKWLRYTISTRFDRINVPINKFKSQSCWSNYATNKIFVTLSHPLTHQYNSIYINVSIANIKTIQPMWSWSSRESGVAKLEKSKPSWRSSKMERTVIPNPTQELGIKQIPILAPLEVKKLALSLQVIL